MRRALVALVILLAAPTAAACDYFIPDGPTHVLWTDGERAFTDQKGEYGYRDLETGAFEKVVDPFDLMSPRVSPDGLWIVWQEAAGTGADCSAQDGRVLAKRIGEAPFVLREQSAAALDVGDARAAVVDEGERAVWIHPLATREAARSFPLESDHVSLLRLSADGRYVAVSFPLVDKLVFLDTSSGATVVELEAREDVQGVAFSPDGTRVAILSGHYGVDARLRVLSLADATILAQRELRGETGSALLWGASGVAAATHTIAYPGDGTVQNDAMLRVFGQPATLGDAHETPFPGSRIESMAATPEGDLVLAVGGALRRVDAPPAGQTAPPTATPSGGTPVEPSTGGRPIPGPALVLVVATFAAAVAARGAKK